MLVGRDKIREIVERADIVAIIGRHVQLKRSGRSYKGLCPFHGERTPSFHVNPDRHSFKCFGCQKGGDVIRFVMEYEGKDFTTALRGLAEELGIPLEVDPEEEKRLEERRRLLWASQVAQELFEATLWSPAGLPGRTHLQERGVTEAIAKEAGLGYAVMAWDALRKRLEERGVPLDIAERAGLITRRDDERGTRFWDTFRGRLMVPIRDAEGRVIAFGGRVIEGDDPRKYVNTRETALYVKSRTLYGLDVARDPIRKAHEATLSEGYFDALALRAAGVPTALALCSTVLTAEHLTQLQRLEVQWLTLVLDGDAAGQTGALRLAGPILAAGLQGRVVELPDKHDPDTFLREHGLPGFRALVEGAKPLSQWVIKRGLAGTRPGIEGRQQAFANLRPVFAALPEGAVRAGLLDEVARALGVKLDDVIASFRASKPDATGRPRPDAGPSAAPRRFEASRPGAAPQPHAGAAPPARTGNTSPPHAGAAPPPRTGSTSAAGTGTASAPRTGATSPPRPVAIAAAGAPPPRPVAGQPPPARTAPAAPPDEEPPPPDDPDEPPLSSAPPAWLDDVPPPDEEGAASAPYDDAPPGSYPAQATPAPRPAGNPPPQPAVRAPQAPRTEAAPHRLELAVAALLLAHAPLRPTHGPKAAAALQHSELRALAAVLGEGVVAEEDAVGQLPTWLYKQLEVATRAVRAMTAAPEQQLQDALARLEEVALREELREAIAARDELEAAVLREEPGPLQDELNEGLLEARTMVSAIKARLAPVRRAPGQG